MAVRAKETKVRPYDSFLCSMCGGRFDSVSHYRLMGQCYACAKCSFHENVKSVLTREYRKELSHLPAIQKGKFLDMMQRDVVRWFKEQHLASMRPLRHDQSKMDLQ